MSRPLPLAALCAALVACAAEREPSPPDLWCSGLCEAVDECLEDESDPTCVQDCIRDRPGLTDYSVRGAELIKPCLAEFECVTLFEEEAWDRGTAACFDGAVAAIEPYDYARSFCTEYTAQYFACGGFYSAELCDREYSMFTETYVQRVAACIDPSCESFLSCLDEVFQ
jgi:hypothetical protein